MACRAEELEEGMTEQAAPEDHSAGQQAAADGAASPRCSSLQSHPEPSVSWLDDLWVMSSYSPWQASGSLPSQDVACIQMPPLPVLMSTNTCPMDTVWPQ